MAKQPRKRMTAKAIDAEDARPFVLPTVPVKTEEDAPGEQWGKDGLTLRQRKFVKAYVGPAAGNATRAAQMAGYGENNDHVAAQTASRLLRKVNVQRRLGREFAKGVGSKAWTRRSIVELANVNIDNYLNDDGSLDLDRARAGGAMGAIKKIEIRELGDAGKQIKVETYDRLKALEIIAKMHGVLFERHEHTGKDGGPIDLRNLTASELDNLESIIFNANRRAGIPDSADARRN